MRSLGRQQYQPVSRPWGGVGWGGGKGAGWGEGERGRGRVGGGGGEGAWGWALGVDSDADVTPQVPQDSPAHDSAHWRAMDAMRPPCIPGHPPPPPSSAFLQCVSYTRIGIVSPSRSSLKLCAFEWVQCSGSWERAVLHRVSLSKVLPTPLL